MAQVEAYRASGMKAKAWAQANGVPLGTLGGWCGHYRRWQAMLEGGDGGDAGAQLMPARAVGFVSARVALPCSAALVRIELSAGAARLELHWPLANTRELAALLREVGR
jgi:hypothetical protein